MTELRKYSPTFRYTNIDSNTTHDLGGSSSSWCFGYSPLFYCGAPCAFHINILEIEVIDYWLQNTQKIYRNNYMEGSGSATIK